MKKIFLSFCAVALLSLSSCSKYDDGPLSNRVDNLENRVKSLEEQCKQLNANITSVQTIVNAIENGDAITSVTPIKEGDKEVGYSFAFSKSPSISVYHGKDGQDGASGSAPEIGIKKDDKGNYCWTINGEWIVGEDGNKVSSTGALDSVLPEFKIDKDNWLMSADGGETWVNLGKGTADGKNAVFNDIDTSDPNKVTFTLSDGTKFELPRQAELTIKFDEQTLAELKAVSPNSTYNISYVVEGSVVGLKLEVISSGNVKAKLNNRNSAKGSITIITGDAVDEYDKVILLASNGKVTVMSSISFGEEDFLQVTSGTTYNVPKTGGTVSINLETNTDYSLSIPEEHKSWVSTLESRAHRQETVTLSISENKDVARTVHIQIVDKGGNAFTSIEISQEDGKEEEYLSIPSDMTIAFPDPNFRNYVLSKFDKNKDGVITEDEALSVKRVHLSSGFEKSISSLEGIQYFKNLEILNCFQTQLTTLDVSGCTALTELWCYQTQLTTLDVSKNTALTKLWCNNNQLTTLDVSKNTSLTELVCSENQLTTLDVSGCTALTTLDCCYNQLTTLDISKNTSLSYLGCYNNQLTTLDVSKNTSLTDLRCNDNQLTTLDVSKNTLLTKLSCPETLKTLYLKSGQTIQDLSKFSYAEIVYID
ncbi:MAG: leucine-rich repeat domain-containing protein [Muribaculaceae bacterium]|nr:leucine-rich repeat domain-containing protein [Muribaculaceae bacterium]